MRRLQFAIEGAALLLAAGCAPQAPMPTLPPPVIVQAPKPKPRHVVTAAEILAAQPPEVQQIIQQHESGARWPTVRRGGTVLYPYSADISPIVDCAPLRTTDIQLGAGETISDLALGDAQRWMATPASSGNAVPHVVIKPEIGGIATNLTVYTTRHIYHADLRAGGRAMNEVEFYFPDDTLQQMAEAEQAAKQTDTQDEADSATPSALPEVDPSHLNFSYKINGAHVAWTPRRAFDDGTRVYLDMPASMRNGPAPALMVDGNGGKQMVNYRVVSNGDGGSYFVIDELFDKAELISGVGREQDAVLVTYAGAAR